MLQKYQYHVEISSLLWLPAAVTAAGEMTGLAASTELLVSPWQGGTPAVKPLPCPREERRPPRGQAEPPRPWDDAHSSWLCSGLGVRHLLSNNSKGRSESEEKAPWPGRAAAGSAPSPVLLAFRSGLTSRRSCSLHRRASH